MKAISPEGNPIIGTLETLEGVAIAAVTLEQDGALAVEYEGTTEVDWNSQKTKMEQGERLFVCANHHVWRETQVKEASGKNKSA